MSVIRPIASLLFVAVLVGLRAGDAADSRPNVLFLFTDDQRADTIAALGNKHIKTPHLDRLTNEGFAFRNAYCMGSTRGAVCLPSRTMLHSGRSLFRLDDVEERPHLGQTMRAAGYETWHLSKRGNTPHALHAAFEHSGYLNDREEREGGYAGRTGAGQAIEFLRSRDASRPFFMFLGFAGPHDPRGTNAEFRGLYDVDKIPLPVNYRPYHPFDNGEMLIRDEQLEAWPRTEEAVRRHLFDYYAMISHMDAQIGRIFEELDRSGLWDDTLIVFSSDHGLAIGSHGLFGKQNLYEDGMKSPLVFLGPGIPHGKSEALAYLFDIYPTICDLTGTEIPDGLDGRSLAPVIHGERESVRETVFLAYKNVQRAVRRGDWKLIRYPLVDVTQLFDLSADPHELNNLADGPAQAATVSELMSLLEREQDRWSDPDPLHVDDPLPAEVDVESFFDGDDNSKN